MFQIAAGIVIGGLVLAFLLRTRSGWYVMIGAPVAVVVGLTLGVLALSILSGSHSHSDAEQLGYVVAVPLLALCTGWWVPRTIAHYQGTAELRKNDDGITESIAIKWAASKAWEEMVTGVMSLAVLCVLLAAPFVWAYGPSPFAEWAKVASLVVWGIVAVLVAAYCISRYREWTVQKVMRRKSLVDRSSDVRRKE